VCCGDRGLCDGPTPRPEECACARVCARSVIRRNNSPLHLQKVGRTDRDKERKKERIHVNRPKNCKSENRINIRQELLRMYMEVQRTRKMEEGED
jgi:hypothetical protein